MGEICEKLVLLWLQTRCVTWHVGAEGLVCVLVLKGKLREERNKETPQNCWNYFRGFPPAPLHPVPLVDTTAAGV